MVYYFQHRGSNLGKLRDDFHLVPQRLKDVSINHRGHVHFETFLKLLLQKKKVFRESVSLMKETFSPLFFSVSVKWKFQFPLLLSIKFDIEFEKSVPAKCFQPDVSTLFCFMFLYFIFWVVLSCWFRKMNAL